MVTVTVTITATVTVKVKVMGRVMVTVTVTVTTGHGAIGITADRVTVPAEAHGPPPASPLCAAPRLIPPAPSLTPASEATRRPDSEARLGGVGRPDGGRASPRLSVYPGGHGMAAQAVPRHAGRASGGHGGDGACRASARA